MRRTHYPSEQLFVSRKCQLEKLICTSPGPSPPTLVVIRRNKRCSAARAHSESISALGERDTCFCTTCIFADKRGHNGLPECIMRILKAQSSGVYTKCCTCLHPGLLPDNKRSKEIAAKKQAVPCDEPAE